ncbi:MAG TPA: dihydroorotase family protein [Chloroflexota bacterium]|nr:dihydroorotase family protein [Chloroflexota bacterium]
MAKVDLVIKNGKIVTHTATYEGVGIAIKDGKFVAIEKEEFLPEAAETLDAQGLYILPGIMDCHVHFRQPGLDYKEDWTTGSTAAICGGVTFVCDMPNTRPPTHDAEQVRIKQEIAESQSFVDFGIIGLISQDNYDQLIPMAEAGVVGYKVFMGETIGNIPAPDDGQLFDSLALVAERTGLRTGFHAENDQILQHNIRKLKAMGRTDPRAHRDSRPIISEVESITRVVTMARYNGAKLHIFHLSSGDGMDVIAAAKRSGVDITAETGPHYLLLDDEYYDRVWNHVRMNPPVRGGEHRERLLAGLLDGRIDMIATDHSPHTEEEKAPKNVWEAISGFVGVEIAPRICLSEFVNKGKMSLNKYVELTSWNPAHVWQVYPQKGAIQVGADADLTFVDLEQPWEIDRFQLHSKNKVTPFHGWKGKGMPVMTMVKGQLVMREGKVVGEPRGRMVRPVRQPTAVAV